MPGFHTSQSPSSQADGGGGGGGGGEQGDGRERPPRSPPPSWEQAVGLAPLPTPAASSDNTPRTTTAPDTPSVPRLVIPDQSHSLSVSPTSSRYESAPSSPFLSPVSVADPPTLHPQTPAIVVPPPLPLPSNLESISTSAPTLANPSTAPSTSTAIAVDQDPNANTDGMTAEERLDRKLWNEDLLAGYSLEERVRREWDRRKVREMEQSQSEGWGQNGEEEREERENELVRGSETEVGGVGAVPEMKVSKAAEATEVMNETEKAARTESVKPKRPSSPILENGQGLSLGLGTGLSTVRSSSVEGSSRDAEPGSVLKVEHKHGGEGGPKVEHQFGSDSLPLPQSMHDQEQGHGQKQDAESQSAPSLPEIGAAAETGEPSLSRKQATSINTSTSVAPSTVPAGPPLLSPPIKSPSHEHEHESQLPFKPKEKVGGKKNTEVVIDVDASKIAERPSPRLEPPTAPTSTFASTSTPDAHSKEKGKIEAQTQLLKEKHSLATEQSSQSVVKEKKEKEKTKVSAAELSSSLPKEKRKEKRVIEKKSSQPLQALRPLFDKIPWSSSPNVDTAGIGATSSQDKPSTCSAHLEEITEKVQGTGTSFEKRRESGAPQERRLNEELQRRKSENDLGFTVESPREEDNGERTGLPPNREAALKRRDLQLQSETPKIRSQPTQPQEPTAQYKSTLPRSTPPVEQPIPTSKPKADVAQPVPARVKVAVKKQHKEENPLHGLSGPLVDTTEPGLVSLPQAQPSTSAAQRQYSPIAQSRANQEARGKKDKRISGESITALAASSADLLQLLESSAEEGPSNSNSSLRDVNQTRIEESARDMTTETTSGLSTSNTPTPFCVNINNTSLDTTLTRGPSSLDAMVAATKKKIPPPPPPPPPVSRSKLHLSKSAGTLRASEPVGQRKQDGRVAGEDGTESARAPLIPRLPPQLPKRRPPPPPPPRHPAAIARLPSPPPSQSQAGPRGRASPPPPPLPPRPRPLSGISYQTISSVSQVSSCGPPAQAQRRGQALESEGDGEGDSSERENFSPGLTRRPLGPRPAPPPRPTLPSRLRLFGNNQTNSSQRMDSQTLDVHQSQERGLEERDRVMDTGSRFVEHIEREGIPPLPLSPPAPQTRPRETIRPIPVASALTPTPIPALRLNNSSITTNGSRPSPAERAHSDFPPLRTQSQLRINQMNERESDNRWASSVDLRERPLSPAISITPAVSNGDRGNEDESRVSPVETPRREESGQGPGAGLHSQAQGQRGIREYTDLDLFVSRLEGSGREYEVSSSPSVISHSVPKIDIAVADVIGFCPFFSFENQGYSQLTTFLGPSKSTAASPEAISTLLPGLITVDSRRTTPQGKVKLKLSLLGVRVSKCPICLSQFRGGEKGVLTPTCAHAAHQSCALRWFREDRRCFICREILKEEE